MFFCKNQKRRLLVGESSSINGIDYLEVASFDQKTLEVHFIHPLPGETGEIPPLAPPLTVNNFRFEGGVRVKNIRVVSVSANDNVLTLTVDAAGDFSLYTLRLTTSVSNTAPPPGFDPMLAELEFSFKAGCPSDFDCKTETVCPEESIPSPRIDYLAKDYASFRRLMLDRMSLIMPQWTERNVADVQIALVEMLAYTGDYLSYYQDAVATEAYLHKSRKRTSARRHARLLDYHVHNGCNARTWISLEVEPGGNLDTHVLAEKTVFLTRAAGIGTTVKTFDLSKTLQQNRVEVFESLHPLTLYAVHNTLNFYTWSDEDCCLPEGATSATLYRKDGQNVFLEPGQVLIFEELRSPVSGAEADADVSHRHAVRLTAVKPGIDILDGTPIIDIEWHEEDALPFPLCISRDIDGVFTEDIAVIRGNVILADHGRTVAADALYPEQAPAQGRYRPFLPDSGVSVATEYIHEDLTEKPASTLLVQDAKSAVPVIELYDGDDTWTARRDLLGASRFDRTFVAEVEADLSVRLRFGDDTQGEQPGEGFRPTAVYRLGNGSSGNVGAEAIGSMVWDMSGLQRVRNPITARGGQDQETLEEIKQYAPVAFRTQERAVTEADYVVKTELHPEVQKALANFRWTGSWHTVFLTIDRKNGLALDEEFRQSVFRHLEQYRMAGYDLEINAPSFVPLEIEMRVCVKQGYFRSNVQAALQQVFSRFDLPDGSRGFFHPDNFTFGQALYLSAVYERAMEMNGVSSVELKTFKRLHRKPQQEIAAGRIPAAINEILRLDNDPNFPENGKINFLMSGGL
jgi:hypothetical protein